VEESDRHLHLNAYGGITPEAATAIQQLDFGAAVCGCVALCGQRIISEDIQNSNDPRTSLVKSFGVQAYCCHPLLAQEKLIGTLSFGTTTRTKFSDDEIVLMKSVSDQVAVAMQRLQTEKKLQQLNKSLMEQVAQRTALAEGRARQLQKLAVELIEAEEKERQKISQLLHDDLQQLLASAKMQLQAAMETIPQDTLLKNVEHLVIEAISKSRHLSHELSPPVLHHTSLVASLIWLIQKMDAQFGLCVTLNADDVDSFVNAPLKVFIFRTVQELLFNIVKHSETKNASIALCTSNNSLVLSVSDQGKGFDPSILNNIGKSSGLGLLSIRERTSLMGGNLSIETAIDQGCHITLILPLITNIDKPKDTQLSKVPSMIDDNFCNSPETIRVLFADDHKVIRQGIIQFIAGKPGIQCIGEAANGFEAVELARQLLPDLIVMDVSMPLMDGIEATQRIKAELPHVKVVGLSMHEDEQVLQAMRQAGAEGFLSKTASTSELLQAIYEVANKGARIEKQPRFSAE